MNSINTAAAADGYRYYITLLDRIMVNGVLTLTHYHIFKPIDPMAAPVNMFVPVPREYAEGNWADRQYANGMRVA